MAEPTLEEQQFHTEIFLSICQRQADQMWYIDQVRLDIQAQTAIVQAQAADVSALKSKVESFQNAFWITAFSVCLCFGAILFRVFTRSAASKRLLGVLLALFVSVSSFAQSSSEFKIDEYFNDSEILYTASSSLPFGDMTTYTWNVSYPELVYSKLTVSNGLHYTIDVVFYFPNGDTNTTSLSVGSSLQVFSDFLPHGCDHFDLTFHAPDSNGAYTPPDFFCVSDAKYGEFKAKLVSYFPFFSTISGSSSSDSISYTFAPDLHSFLSHFYLNATVTIDQTKVSCGATNPVELDHTVFTSPFKILIKFVFSILAFSYCLKELRQW